MRLLIAGWQSQVAQALMTLAARNEAVGACALCRPGLELAALPTVQRQFKDQRPDVIVNASAYRDVRGADQDREAAMALNRDGAARLAAAANEVGAAIIHISSFHVFSGVNDRPWRPDDSTEPTSFYGETRVAGEEAVRGASPNHVILRTGWLLSGTGANFLTKVRDTVSAAGPRPFRAVDDQFGTPSFAHETAGAILQVAAQLSQGSAQGATAGTYHFAAPDQASWADIAEAVACQAAAAQDSSATRPGMAVERIAHATFRAEVAAAGGTPTAPFPNACLDSSSFASRFALHHAPWRDALQDAVCSGADRAAAPSAQPSKAH